MVRQHDPSIDMKWTLRLCSPHGISQRVNFVHEQGATSPGQGDGEEDGGSGDLGADVIRHGTTMRGSRLTGIERKRRWRGEPRPTTPILTQPNPPSPHNIPPLSPTSPQGIHKRYQQLIPRKFRKTVIFPLHDSSPPRQSHPTGAAFLRTKRWTQRPRRQRDVLDGSSDLAGASTGNRMQVGSCGSETGVANGRCQQG